MKVLIVTGGSIDQEFACEYIAEEGFDRMIASDSGMHFFYRAGICPQDIVGDFDSADPKVLAYFEAREDVAICKLNPIKDDTDTEHAIRMALADGATEITILGATGTRIDHIMGNIALTGIGLEHQVPICMVDPHNRIRLINQRTVIEREQQFGRFVSLIPFLGSVRGVTLTGMKYPLDHYDMGGFNSLGVSNEIMEEEAVIDLEDGYLLVIESRD